ncbi:Hypothetical predicted protein [Olea europaea subsp. europaea]|uniref:Transcription factor n=1 Tax=Olea europaea subsp. europaea TaxID=158383 RepID=A0A8S0UGK6_OLEEU|nr:Hypothetical predicted protein [Olea europaea subsp. europaea]
MNLWTSSSTTKIAATTITTDDNASMMEAFMSSSSDLGSFWPATYAPNPADQSKSSASAAQIFNYETLQKRLSTLIEGAHESWTYAIFWQSSVVDYGGPFLLGWGDGPYGIFHLCDPCGIAVIRKCYLRGFHLHEEPDDFIYENSFHVHRNPDSEFDVIDLL